jgi:hypothetical protein
MLLNLSNHPSNTWRDAQMEAARQQYGDVQDWPFPAIDPHWSRDEVKNLADLYAERIHALRPRPKAIHIMGELTFVFCFVHKMLDDPNGLPCVASTTRRKVTEPEVGKKIVEFEFVKFRSYG